MDKIQKAVLAIGDACEDVKGEDICVLDLSQIESYADYMVITHTSNERQLNALADRVVEQAYKVLKRHPLGVEGYHTAQWVLVDFGDVICHVFSEEARSIYHLEDMWPQVKPMSLEKFRDMLKKPISKKTKQSAKA